MLTVEDGVDYASASDSRSRPGKLEHPLRRVRPAPARAGRGRASLGAQRPSPGTVEHDPDELLAGALDAISEVVEEIEAAVAALGLANQTESFVLWERDHGEPPRPGGELAGPACERPVLGDRSAAGAVRSAPKTGLALDPTFSAPKLAWLFEPDPELRSRAEAGELSSGTSPHGSPGISAAERRTSRSRRMACRTLLVDLETLSWDEGLLDLFGVPAALLPEIRPSDDPGGRTSGALLGFEAPLAAMLGDQPAALYGQGCTLPRMAALTLGTGAFVWLNAGAEPPGASGRCPSDGRLAEASLRPHVRARGLQRECRQRS